MFNPVISGLQNKWEGDLLAKDNKTRTFLAGLDIFSMKNHTEAVWMLQSSSWHWVDKICALGMGVGKCYF